MLITIVGPDDNRKNGLALSFTQFLSSHEIPVDIVLEPQGLVGIDRLMNSGLVGEGENSSSDELLDFYNYQEACKNIESEIRPGTVSILMGRKINPERFITSFRINHLEETVPIDASYSDQEIFEKLKETLESRLALSRMIERK